MMHDLTLVKSNDFLPHRGTTDPTKNCIELNSQPVGLERINKTIYVGTMDESLHCYTSKVGRGR